MRRTTAAALGLAAALAFTISAAAATTGTWELYPPQSSTYTTAVQQPINADGSSKFANNRKAVIPVKFELFSQTGPVVFQSLYENGVEDGDEYSFLSFAPSPLLKFSDLGTLKADYAFMTGNCQGGSLRWSIRIDLDQDGVRDPYNDPDGGGPVPATGDPVIFVYYGAYPNFTDCTTPDAGGLDSNQSGENMIGKPDLRYDTSQFNNHSIDGPWNGTTGFYDSYANALQLFGGYNVLSTSLVLDSGWVGCPAACQDQLLAAGSPSNVTVNDNTFVPTAGTPTKTCDLPPATIQITKTAGLSEVGLVNEPVSIQPADNDANFRVVDCKYMYNLATSSLFGSGTYKVEVVIDGTPVAGPAIFDIK